MIHLFSTDSDNDTCAAEGEKGGEGGTSSVPAAETSLRGGRVYPTPRPLLVVVVETERAIPLVDHQRVDQKERDAR